MYRITTFDGRSSCSKPIGLLTSMLRLEGNKSTFAHAFSICVVIYIIYSDISRLRTSTKLEMCFIFSNSLSLVAMLLWFLRLRSKKVEYIELIDTFENQTRFNLDNSQVYQHFTSIRKCFSFMVIIILLLYTFANIYTPIMIFRKSNDYVQLGQSLLLGLLSSICILCFQIYNQFLVESCLHIHACWFIVNEQIRLLNSTDSRLLSINQVREVRSMYSIAAVITEKMDSFLRIPIFNFFSFFILSSISVIAQVCYEPTLFGCVSLLWRLLKLTLITYNMIYAHYLSHKCFDDVYSLSHKTRSITSNNEVQLFLDRISQSDIGFSFLKISLITPTFVTSWTSTTLTIVLSLPSLL
uniref:Gustatory receptor n=1 Tax=Tetranychus urticae TaxID=32264 RepID=T1KAL3_TETUR